MTTTERQLLTAQTGHVAQPFLAVRLGRGTAGFQTGSWVMHVGAAPFAFKGAGVDSTSRKTTINFHPERCEGSQPQRLVSQLNSWTHGTPVSGCAIGFRFPRLTAPRVGVSARTLIPANHGALAPEELLLPARTESP
jgi:hypothetical protein